MAIIKKVKITDDFITLGQFLKVADLVSSGGEVKYFILNKNILVNGSAENRRGRKLYKEDLITIDEDIYQIC